VTQGRVEYESTILRGTDDGFDLWETDAVLNRRYRDTRNKIVFVNPCVAELNTLSHLTLIHLTWRIW